MPNALFSFDDLATAQRAADRLTQGGFTTETVRVHSQGAGPDHVVSHQIDEVVTGGFVGNFAAMFRGLFSWDGTAHGPESYAETISRGGAVVSVAARSEAEMAQADAVMASAAPQRRTDWDDTQSV